MNSQPSSPALSVVIPTYNSAEWLPSTIASIARSTSQASLPVEVVIVDDGSTDNTEEVIASIDVAAFEVFRYIRTSNQGVYQAVRTGALQSSSSRLLIVNSRLIVDEHAFRHLELELADEEIVETRNGHVATSNDVPIVGRFWEVPTHVFWGSYLRNPKLTLLTSENFDSVPKGTGFLVVGRERLLGAYESVGEIDSKFVSDDTKLLRHIAAERAIILDPDFKAIYRPRTTVKKFLAHGYLRGTLFVDSYFGTSAARTLALLVIALSIPIGATMVASSVLSDVWLPTLFVVVAFAIVVVALAIVSVVNRAPSKAVLSFLVYVLPFAFVFWAGVVRGLWLRVAKGNS